MTDKGMLVLQNCVNFKEDVAGLCSETCATSSHDAIQAINNIKDEEVSDIEEEEDPVPISFPAMKPEAEVSCTSV
jgi:hypothetical protein